MAGFTEAKQAFDEGLGKAGVLPQSLVPVDGKVRKDISIRGADSRPLEEFYKWQFVYALIQGGLYAKDYIGVEVRFPKGSKGSQPIKLVGAPPAIAASARSP